MRVGCAGRCWSHRPEIPTKSPHVLGDDVQLQRRREQLLLTDFVRANVCTAQSEKGSQGSWPQFMKHLGLDVTPQNITTVKTNSRGPWNGGKWEWLQWKCVILRLWLNNPNERPWVYVEYVFLYWGWLYVFVESNNQCDFFLNVFLNILSQFYPLQYCSSYVSQNIR